MKRAAACLMTLRLVCTFAGTSWAVGTSVAHAAPGVDEDTAALLRQAASAVEQGRFSEAADRFSSAYERDPQPVYLYREAIARREAGELEQAIALLERFIATNPADADRNEAAARLREVEEVLLREAEADGRHLYAAQLYAARYRRGGAPEALLAQAIELRSAGECEQAILVAERYLDTGPAPAAASQARDEVSRCREPARLGPKRPEPRVVDPVFLGVASGGGALTGTGLGLLIAANFTARQAAMSVTEDAWVTRARRTDGLVIAGTVLSAAGGALLVGALVRLAIQRKRGRNGTARTRSGVTR